jgi:hypothetical protein
MACSLEEIWPVVAFQQIRLEVERRVVAALRVESCKSALAALRRAAFSARRRDLRMPFSSSRSKLDRPFGSRPLTYRQRVPGGTDLISRFACLRARREAFIFESPAAESHG